MGAVRLIGRLGMGNLQSREFKEMLVLARGRMVSSLNLA